MTVISLRSEDIDSQGRIKFKADWKNITSIYATNQTTLKIVDNLPHSLTRLSLAGCSEIIKLDSFPPDLEALDLFGCTNLSSLSLTSLAQKSPTKLGILNLSNCEKIEFTEELKRDLQVLERNGCKVIYPKDNRNIAEAGLKLARIANMENKSAVINTRLLLSRYFTELVEERDRQGLLAENLLTVLNILETNPQHFSWVEEIATIFVGDGCINQPVAGFFEIATWLIASSYEDHQKKIEALTPLMVMSAIIYFIKSELQKDQEEKLSPSYEVEVGMLMLKAVHNRILDEGKIKSPWFAIPQKIAYENRDEVQKFLNTENLDKVYSLATNILKQSTREKTQFFENAKNAHMWGAIAFPEVFEDVKNSAGRNSGMSEADSPNTFKKRVVDVEDIIMNKIMELTRSIFPSLQVVVKATKSLMDKEDEMERI